MPVISIISLVSVTYLHPQLLSALQSHAISPSHEELRMHVWFYQRQAEGELSDLSVTPFYLLLIIRAVKFDPSGPSGAIRVCVRQKMQRRSRA